MKISKIILANFQAFPYEFELPLGGKNALLYGENGSGKSSLYRSLKEAMHEVLLPASQQRDWNNLFPNIFMPTYLPVGVPVRISWQMDDKTLYNWGMGVPVPSTPEVREIALRAGFLDYRRMMRLSFRQEKVELNEVIFSVLVSELLGFINVPIGRSPRPLHQFWQKVKDETERIKKWSIPSLQKRQPFLDDFNIALATVLRDLILNASRLLNYFDQQLDISFNPTPIFYKPGNSNKNIIQGQSIELSVSFRNKPIVAYESFLNEARLSAMAISIFLAGVQLANPVSVPGNPVPLSLVVLDDALIGLEVGNRLPLLKILENEFPDSQIILFTHDKVWFEIAREYLQSTGKWRFSELYALNTNNFEPSYPVLLGDVDEIKLAKKHFDNHDLTAAAIYARAAFEKRLRNLCDRKVVLQYRKNPKDIKADDLWSSFKTWHNLQASPLFPAVTIREIDAFRSNVLNRLSHYGASSLTRHEVHRAILALEVFCT